MNYFGVFGRYVACKFLVSLLGTMIVILLLILLIDSVELLRKAAGTGTTGIQLMEMALLRAPELLLTVLHFVVLLAGLVSFYSLSRHSEFVVARAAGQSIWRLIAPAIIVAVALGFVSVFLFNPVAAVALQRYELLQSRYFDQKEQLFSVSDEGIWLRESDANREIVIHAERASSDLTQLWNVGILLYGPDQLPYQRLEARRVVPADDVWTLYQVKVWNLPGATQAGGPAGVAKVITPNLDQESHDEITLRSGITRENLRTSLTHPDMIPIWKLRDFIAAQEDAGLNAANHRVHLHKLLSTPLLFGSMVLLAAVFARRQSRQGRAKIMLMGCIASALSYFFFANVSQAFGNSGEIRPWLAGWVPPISVCFISIGLLLHLEDG